MIKIGNMRDVLTHDFINECIKHANVYKPRGRTPKEILRHTLCGEVVEILVNKYFDLNAVPFSISEYDGISSDGIKYEIKHTIHNNKWWNFIYDKYSFFISNANDLDYIVLCYLDVATCDIYLKFKAKATTFIRYSSESNFNKGWYYNVDLAEDADQCIIY